MTSTSLSERSPTSTAQSTAPIINLAFHRNRARPVCARHALIGQKLIAHCLPLLTYLNRGESGGLLAPAIDLNFLFLDLIAHAENLSEELGRGWHVVSGHVTLPDGDGAYKVKSAWLTSADGEILDLLHPDIAGGTPLARDGMSAGSDYIGPRQAERNETSILYAVLRGAMSGIDDFASKEEMLAAWAELRDSAAEILAPEAVMLEAAMPQAG